VSLLNRLFGRLSPPSWQPLKKRLGEEECRQFTVVRNGALNVYRHTTTGVEFGLDDQGHCFAFKNGRYGAGDFDAEWKGIKDRMAVLPATLERQRSNLQALVQKARQELDQAIRDCAGGSIDVGYENQRHPEQSWAWQQVLEKRATLERAVENVIRVSSERPDLADVCRLEDPEYHFCYSWTNEDFWGNLSTETTHLGSKRLDLSFIRRLAAPIPRQHLGRPSTRRKGLSSKQKTAILWVIILLIAIIIFVVARFS